MNPKIPSVHQSKFEQAERDRARLERANQQRANMGRWFLRHGVVARLVPGLAERTIAVAEAVDMRDASISLPEPAESVADTLAKVRVADANRMAAEAQPDPADLLRLPQQPVSIQMERAPESAPVPAETAA